MIRRHKMPYLVGILLLIILALGWVGNYSVNRVADLTEDLYEHPLVVSTAVLRIHTNIIIMHRAMKDIVLSDSPAATDLYHSIVEKREEQVLTDFALVEERFLGDIEMVEAARRTFIAWKPIREGVLRQVQEGKRPEAADISQTTSNRQVEEIESKIGVLRDYARNKSREFLAAAKQTRSRTVWLVWVSLGGSLVLAGFVMFKAVRIEDQLLEFNKQLDLKVRQRTAELATANESLTAQNEESTAMNEELTAQNDAIMAMNEEVTAQNEEITAMNEEIVKLNQRLSEMNDALEGRVAEKTAELLAANQELMAKYDEIMEFNEKMEQRVRDRTAELEALNREMEGFNHSVSHDLRAPVRHIVGFAGILQETLAEKLDADGRDYLQIMIGAAHKLEQMMDALLAFSRAGKADMLQQRVDMTAIVGEIVESLNAECKERGIVWKINELPEVIGDRTLLKLVWGNLLGNAVKYTQHNASAKIEICADRDSQDDAVVVFSVKDNGAGFDMRYKDKLFGLFQRLHGENEFAGSGVGLANAKRVIVRHGGKIWAEGKVNEGATFYFTLEKFMVTEHSNAGLSPSNETAGIIDEVKSLRESAG